MNKFIISGNLTKDPWIADSGKVMKITVAVSKGYSQEKEAEVRKAGQTVADFFEVTVFNDAQIKWLRDSLKKGDGVICDCKLHNQPPREYVNKNGTPEIRYEQVIVLKRIEITNRRSASAKGKAEPEFVEAEEDEEDPVQLVRPYVFEEKTTSREEDDEW